MHLHYCATITTIYLQNFLSSQTATVPIKHQHPKTPVCRMSQGTCLRDDTCVGVNAGGMGSERSWTAAQLQQRPQMTQWGFSSKDGPSEVSHHGARVLDFMPGKGNDLGGEKVLICWRQSLEKDLAGSFWQPTHQVSGRISALVQNRGSGQYSTASMTAYLLCHSDTLAL